MEFIAELPRNPNGKVLRRTNTIDGEVLAINGIDAEPERTRIAERCAEQIALGTAVAPDVAATPLNPRQAS